MAERRPVQFARLLGKLAEHEVQLIVVGGVAAVLEGAPISTFDLDVLVKLDDENTGRLVSALDDLDAIYVDPAGRTIRPTRERLSSGGFHLLRTRFGRLDVLGRVGEDRGYDELIGHSRPRRIGGVSFPVLGLAELIRVKEQANRPKDRAVLGLLRQTLAEREGRSTD